MKVLLRILFFPLSLLRFLFIVVATAILLPCLMLEDVLSRRNGKYRFLIVRTWAKMCLLVLGYIVKRNKLYTPEKYIIMPNHRSYVDIFLLGTFSPSAFISKIEIMKWPLYGTALKYSKAVVVNREEMKSLTGAMRAIRQRLDEGISITLFPEGTTTKGPGTIPFKNGSFKIAAELNVPVIPCAICFDDPEDAWVGNDTFIPHFFRQMWKPVSHAEIRFGKPITGNDFKVLKDETRQAIEAMLEQMEGDSQKNKNSKTEQE